MLTASCFLRCLIITVLLGLTGSLHAQMNPGFLGKRYLDGALFLESVQASALETGVGTQAGINLPLTRAIDLRSFASYERFSELSFRDSRIGASAIFYCEQEYFKPFVKLGLAGTWQSARIAGTTVRENDGLYAGALGVEAALGAKTALLLEVGLNKYFDGDHGEYWSYTLGFNRWFNEKIGLQLAVAFNESESTVITAGIACRF